MRMRGGYAQQIVPGFAVLRDPEELALHAVLNYIRMDHPWRAAVVTLQIVGSGLGDGDQSARAPRRCPQEKLPERKIEPAKVFRMALMLEIVKYCNHWAAA